MGAEILWWLLALGLGLAELFTGTFFLLLIALGCMLAGLVAFAGFGLTGQLGAAAVGCLVGAVWLRRRKRAAEIAMPAQFDPQLMLDIGGRVEVTQWRSARRTEVRYRGATWQVELVDGAAQGKLGDHVIEEVDGNTLRVAPLAP